MLDFGQKMHLSFSVGCRDGDLHERCLDRRRMEETDSAGRTYVGAASSPGLGIGQILIVGYADLAEIPDRPAEDIETEVVAAQEAVAAACRLARSHWRRLWCSRWP